MSYCDWFSENALQRAYHEEWGTPLHDDCGQFEYLSMEVMQCGLSFGLVLRRRPVLRACFDDFDYDKVATYTDTDIKRIMNTDGMIKAERKIRAIIGNARAFQQVRAEFGTFTDYLWGFTGNQTVLYRGHEIGYIPASNRLSENISKDLKKRGFSFVGPVVIYSHLQACGIINDHAADCPRRQLLIDAYPTVEKRRYGEKGLHQF
jgi:DNA-3-methyladenine glycosylase I